MAGRELAQIYTRAEIRMEDSHKFRLMLWNQLMNLKHLGTSL